MAKARNTWTDDPIVIKKNLVIYFAIVSDDAAYTNLRIKIGKATDFAKRRREHEASKLGLRIYFEPLCVVRGQASDESAIHRYFREFQYNGEEEVFHPSDSLVDYIRWLRDQYFAWVPENCDYAEPDEVIDSSQWLPIAGRKKPVPVGVLPGVYGPLNLPPPEITADDFYTHSRILNPVRVFLGGEIDLDPASHAIANREVKSRRFFTRNDNGLMQPWCGRVWCNPPFSHWGDWAPKIASEWKRGGISEMCVLAACRTLTAQQFSPVVKTASAICVLFGRIPFWGSNATSSPDDGHCIFYFGNRCNEFSLAMAEIGTTFVNPGA